MENWCEQVEVLKAMSMLKNIYNLALIIIPVILVIVLMVSFIKKVFSDDDNYKELISSSLRKFFSVVVIVFLPNLIISVLSFTMNGRFDSDLLCLDKANEAGISTLEVVAEERAKAVQEQEKKAIEQAKEEQKIKENDQKIKSQDYSTSGKIDPFTYVSKTFTPIIDGVQRPLENGECMSKEDNCFCPNISIAKGFQFTMAAETGRDINWHNNQSPAVSITIPCKGAIKGYSTKKGGYYDLEKITVSSDVKDKFEKALEGICRLYKAGRIPYLRSNGTYATRLKADRTVCSPHGYGIAMDLNSGEKYQFGGITYEPYSGQGPGAKTRYDAFVKGIGSESNDKNLNYLIWKEAFEPAEFEWGGEWRVSSFDPMHYEVKR